MYWGSVRFYKHLILTTLMLIFLVPTSLAMSFALVNAQLKGELTILKAEMAVTLMPYQEEGSQPARLSSFSMSGEENTGFSFELAYQNLYPDLNIGALPIQERIPNTIYLTFDDGPSSLTAKALDVLKEKGVTATFFVVGKNLESEEGKQILKRIVDEGHTVGVHTYSHVYADIYKSVEAYLDDFYLVYDLIYNITGIRAEIYRFPGGSINAYNSAIYQELIAEMSRRGFVYYDWNVSSQDTVDARSEQKIFNNVVSASIGNTRNIVLMHDSAGKAGTLKALPGIIEELEAAGYQFDILSRSVAPVHFGYRN